MPEISRFLGMVIHIYFDDHSEPHLHVRLAESRCKIDFEGNILNGSLPIPKLNIVKKWIMLHQKELFENWKRIRKGKLPERIEPWE